MMNKLINLLSMDSYTSFVWAAFGLTLAVLLALFGKSLLSLSIRSKQLRRLKKQEKKPQK
jgi:heme exporter protein CcmD